MSTIPAPRVGADTLAYRKLVALWVILAIAVPLVFVTGVLRLQANPILAAFTFALILAAWNRPLLAWPSLLGYVLVVILFIPIRRFALGGGFPIAIEPYRVLIIVVLACWLLGALADPATRWRRTGFEAPIIGIIGATLIGLALNVPRIVGGGLSGAVAKDVTFFASFLLIMYFVSSAIETRKQLDRIVMLIVAGGAVVGLATLIEWRVGYNLFNHLDRAIPILHVDPNGLAEPPTRGGRVRAYASAQHPIALGAVLVLMMPLGIYLYRRTHWMGWLVCSALMVFGALATGSRTAALMLVVELLCFFWMKRKETMRLLPMLLPLFIACQVLMPGTLGTFKAIIFPEGGNIIQEQKGGQGMGEGRVADIGPSLQELSREPFFGQGFGTRLTSESDDFINARILDNQWLSTLLEMGVIGTFFMMWLYLRATRALAKHAKTDSSSRGWLLATLGSGLCAFNVGMFTYDAYSFIQVTFISFIVIGLAGVAIRLAPDDD